MEDMSRLDVAIKSSEDAYNMSKMSPKDIDFAMIYDSFTITVLMSLEALGFCKIGEGKDFVKNGNGDRGSQESKQDWEWWLNHR